MKVYNTLTGKKEEFKPIDDKEVKMYVCGPTVYNYIHLGNARAAVTFDVIRRYLEYKGYRVIFVQNITDIDDKMIKNANEQGIEVNQLADKFIHEYFVDADGLGIKRATFHPKATEHISDIIEMIKILQEKGYAYAADGDVYFDTSKFKQYGKLSGQSLEELELGKRIDVDERKKNPMDFALWKAKKPSEPSWQSPWGEGRPGWHIECSAMSTKCLGNTLDIHGGGRDLIFPHHENEIAQSEAATGEKFVNYWIHNGYINIDNKKMSKSEGNFFTVRDIADKYDYEVIRFFLLQSHYRSPINFTHELLEQSKAALERLYACIDNLAFLKQNVKSADTTEREEQLKQRLGEMQHSFSWAMDDDFNTADAVAVIFDMVREVNTFIAECTTPSLEIVNYCYSLIKELGGVLGILCKERVNTIDDDIEQLIAKRQEARQNKDWKTADEIRDMLKDRGITIEDTPQGMKWSRNS